MKQERKSIHKLSFIILVLIFTLLLSIGVLSASLTVDKPVIQTGETVTATFSISWTESEGAFVGFFKKDAGDGSWISYKNCDFNTTTLTLADPTYKVTVEEPGSYEFRLFKDYYGTKKVATAAVEVVFSPTSTVTAQNPTASVGDKVIANYSISKIDGENTAGWVGIYKVGTDDGQYLTYQKTGGVSGSFSVDTTGWAAGAYNFRLFKDYYGVYKLATSGTITLTAKDDREDSRARFNTLTGEVRVSPDPELSEGVVATLRTVLRVGDHIITGPDSYCIIQFEDMTNFTVKPNSEVIINKPVAQETKLGLVMGHIWTNTKKILTNGTMEVEMGQAVAGIKGTIFVCEVVNGKSTLKVIEGVVELTSKVDHSKIVIGTGEMVVADSTGIGKKQSFDKTAETNSWITYGADVTIKNEKVIVLQTGNPLMQVNTVKSEIDPGKGTTPMLFGGRTILPIRAVIEAMGGSVEWKGSESKVTIKYKTTTIEMWIGKTTILVNGVAKVMDVSPQVIKSRTMLPVRFIAENLGAGVTWDAKTQEAYINFIQ